VGKWRQVQFENRAGKERTCPIAEIARAAAMGLSPATLQNHLGERLDFSFHHAADDAPTIIIGHGVTGHKDRPLLIALAEALADHGLNALRISFAGNAGSSGRFEESTVLKEVQELGAVLDALPASSTIGYIGHSMGGAVGVLRASQDRRIQFLVSVAGMVHTAEFAKREFGELKPGVDCMWDKPGCVYSTAYRDAMNATGNVLAAAQKVTVPWLLIHGTDDTVVPVQDSRDIRELRPDVKLVEISGADHLFADHTPAAVPAVVEWIRALKL